MNNSRPTSSRRAFTLLEILVVCTVIALLVAILLPALGKVKDQARTAACSANLHSLGLGTANYVTNNYGLLFPSTINWFDNTGQLGLQDILVQFVSTSVDLTTNRGKVYFCPSAVNPNLGDQSQFPMCYDANMGVHIRLTPAIIGGAHVMPPLNRISQLPRTNDVIAIGDGAQATKPVYTAGQGYFDNTGIQWSGPWVAAPSRGDLPINAGINDPNQRNQIAFGNTPNNTDDQSAGYHPRYRHNANSVSNFLMVDGHVQSFKYKTALNSNFSTAY